MSEEQCPLKLNAKELAEKYPITMIEGPHFAFGPAVEEDLVRLHGRTGLVGKLSVKDGILTFEGNADAAARIFFQKLEELSQQSRGMAYREVNVKLPALYQHYKGDRYVVLAVVRDSTNALVATWRVIYYSLEQKAFRTRTYGEFAEWVQTANDSVPRFRLIEDRDELARHLTAMMTTLGHEWVNAVSDPPLSVTVHEAPPVNG